MKREVRTKEYLNLEHHASMHGGIDRLSYSGMLYTLTPLTSYKEIVSHGV